MAESQALVDVYAYDDHRAFLRDTYLEGKRRRRLSYRSFSRRARLSSPNYLKLVIEGERNLTASMAARFAKALFLDQAQTEYFAMLVELDQTPEGRAADLLRRKVEAARTVHRVQRLEAAHAAYCSRWYLPAIRELVVRKDFKDDARWISSKLRPRITMAEARQALGLLLELGLLVRDADGRLKQSEAVLSTGAQASDVHVANYHRMMLLQAANAMASVPAAERDISSLTLSVSEQGMKRLKQRIVEFRRELLELSEADRAPRKVVQVNFQLFPLSED